MDIVTVIFMIVIGVICAFIHKDKWYSPVSGFCWGFFLSVIGLIVVLFEKTKEEQDKEMMEKKGLSMGQWLAIFLGIGIGGIIIFLFIMSILTRINIWKNFANAFILKFYENACKKKKKWYNIMQ
mgnify:CR=1 FL=1